MLRRKTIIFASIALAGVSVACGLAAIGTGDPYCGSTDGADDRAAADGALGATDGSAAGDGNQLSPDGSAGASTKDGDAGAVVDAAPVCDPGMCTTAGGKCGAGNVCAIDCTKSGAGPCTTPTCPAGHACVIICAGGFCTGGVNCAAATSCDIQCSGGACTNPITCGGTSCSIACSGNACTDDITCTAARCNILCVSGNSCPKKVTCASAIACSVTCSKNAVCLTLDVAAPDAAVSCGNGTGGNDCNDVSCYADGGQCFVGCA